MLQMEPFFDLYFSNLLKLFFFHSTREVQFDYDTDLNKQYTTQAWSKRFLNGMNVQALHVAFATEGTIGFLSIPF